MNTSRSGFARDLVHDERKLVHQTKNIQEYPDPERKLLSNRSKVNLVKEQVPLQRETRGDLVSAYLQRK